MTRRRAGYSLIETLVVISVLGMLMLVSATTLHGLYSSQRRLSQTAVRQGAWFELATHIRRDAHRAAGARRSAAADGQGQLETLALDLGDDWTVEYQLDSAGVRRVERRGSQRPPHRELFRLAPGSDAGWRLISEPGGRQRLVLHVRPAGGERPVAADEVLFLEAVVGLLPGRPLPADQPEARP